MAGNTAGLSTSMVLGNTVSWGIHGSARTNIKDAIYGNGIVTAWSCRVAYDKSDCRNEVGSKIGEVVYDYSYSARATLQCSSSTRLPEPTTIITINGVKFHVVDAELAESNQDFCKINVSLEASGYQFTPELADSSFNNTYTPTN